MTRWLPRPPGGPASSPPQPEPSGSQGGRGIPKPQAVDEEVQDEIDEFWTDPDNQRILTTHAAQVRFNTDLSSQSNVFPLIYDEGEDGQVLLGLLDHDTVEQAVRDRTRWDSARGSRHPQPTGGRR